MIDAARAEKAAEFLVSSAADYGAARAEAIKADDMLRVTKALAMAQSIASSVSAQEKEAYASPRYKEAIDRKFEAVKHAETLKAQRDGAQQVIEFWRSANKTMRDAERGFHAAR